MTALISSIREIWGKNCFCWRHYKFLLTSVYVSLHISMCFHNVFHGYVCCSKSNVCLFACLCKEMHVLLLAVYLFVCLFLCFAALRLYYSIRALFYSSCMRKSFQSDCLLCLCFGSLRVNLDMGKLVYSWMIQRDKKIPDTIVRNSTIPEELGRIVYLLSDKTGTLTQNEMVSTKIIKFILFYFVSVCLSVYSPFFFLCVHHFLCLSLLSCLVICFIYSLFGYLPCLPVCYCLQLCICPT